MAGGWCLVMHDIYDRYNLSGPPETRIHIMHRHQDFDPFIYFDFQKRNRTPPIPLTNSVWSFHTSAEVIFWPKWERVRQKKYLKLDNFVMRIWTRTASFFKLGNENTFASSGATFSKESQYFLRFLSAMFPAWEITRSPQVCVQQFWWQRKRGRRHIWVLFSLRWRYVGLQTQYFPL